MAVVYIYVCVCVCVCVCSYVRVCVCVCGKMGVSKVTNVGSNQWSLTNVILGSFLYQ